MSVGSTAFEVWALTGMVSPTIWAIVVVASPVLAFSVARWLSARLRLFLLLVVILLPVWLLTMPMILLPPSPDSFGWWSAGMLMIAPVAVAWGMFGAIGAKLGWRNVR